MGGDSATTQRMRCRAMKRCAWCHGRLGLGVRSRNLWNGSWWIHVRFCSTHCEALYELERYDVNARRWRTLLAPHRPHLYEVLAEPRFFRNWFKRYTYLLQ